MEEAGKGSGFMSRTALILSLGLNEELGTEIKDSEEGAGNIDVVVTDLKKSDKPSKPPTDKLESHKGID